MEFQRSHVGEHLKSECEYRKVKCDYCQKEVPFASMKVRIKCFMKNSDLIFIHKTGLLNCVCLDLGAFPTQKERSLLVHYLLSLLLLLFLLSVLLLSSLYYSITCGNYYRFRLKNGNKNYDTLYKNIENLRTSQGYILSSIFDNAIVSDNRDNLVLTRILLYIIFYTCIPPFPSRNMLNQPVKVHP